MKNNEPTPYCVLERLANSGLIRKKDVVLDYGCGKGRVDFFLYYPSKEYISYLMTVKALEFFLII